MKNVKFSLSNIEGKLSRVEMKQILGGSGGSSDCPYFNCNCNISHDNCSQGRRVYRGEAKMENYICCLNDGATIPL